MLLEEGGDESAGEGQARPEKISHPVIAGCAAQLPIGPPSPRGFRRARAPCGFKFELYLRRIAEITPNKILTSTLMTVMVFGFRRAGVYGPLRPPKSGRIAEAQGPGCSLQPP